MLLSMIGDVQRFGMMLNTSVPALKGISSCIESAGSHLPEPRHTPHVITDCGIWWPPRQGGAGPLHFLQHYREILSSNPGRRLQQVGAACSDTPKVAMGQQYSLLAMASGPPRKMPSTWRGCSCPLDRI